ncbi:hypothetical protein IDVR_04080 [Intrasporangium sp. DVR]
MPSAPRSSQAPRVITGTLTAESSREVRSIERTGDDARARLWLVLTTELPHGVGIGWGSGGERGRSGRRASSIDDASRCL